MHYAMDVRSVLAYALCAREADGRALRELRAAASATRIMRRPDGGAYVYALRRRKEERTYMVYYILFKSEYSTEQLYSSSHNSWNHVHEPCETQLCRVYSVRAHTTARNCMT